MCSLFCVTLGLFLILLGAWATQQFFRFTPVYSDVQFSFEPVKLDKFSFNGGFHVNLTLTVTCDNPNPYTVEVRSTDHLQVYMGKNRHPVAIVTDLPHATLPAHGKGSIAAHVSIVPTRKTLGPAATAVFGGQVPMYIEIELEVSLALNFIFGNFSATVPFVKDCGLMVQLYAIGGRNTGPLVCADSFDDFMVAKIDRSPGAATKPQPLTLMQRQLIEAERAKTTGLGTLMGLFYGFGFPIVVLSSWYLCKLGWCCGCCGCNCCEEEDLQATKGTASKKTTVAKSAATKKAASARSKSASRHCEEIEQKVQV